MEGGYTRRAFVGLSLTAAGGLAAARVAGAVAVPRRDRRVVEAGDVEAMSRGIRADVIVVGAGIAGSLAATGLARAGVKVAVLEAGPTVDRAEAVDRFRNATAKVPESPYP